MALADLKQIAERALRIIRVLEDLPPSRQIEVMTVATAMVSIEAQRALHPPPQQEVKDE
jgi:hypothetical protein